jgi:hypothetical protein
MTPLFSLLVPLRPQRAFLLFGSTLSVFFCIILQNSGVFPLDGPTFFFFSFVLFLGATYRLGWAFLFLVALIPLEIINVAPALLGGLALRPYQWVAGVLLLALATRFLFGRLPFRLFRPIWVDALPVILTLGGFIAFLNAPQSGIALKQAIVVASFVSLYLLGRIFFRTLYDIRQALPFFLVSSMLVLGYAVWQNIRFLFGQESYQVMAGRPNATFSEADWLGLFVVVVLGIVLALVFRYRMVHGQSWRHLKERGQLVFLFLSLLLTMLVLILTMARSAWLGAVGLAGAFFWVLVFENGWRELRRGLHNAMLPLATLTLSFLGAIGLVYFFTLSPFPLLSRIQSTGGLQSITIACEQESYLPVTLEKIENLEQLSVWHCRHIMLEEIDAEEQAGKFITTVYRDDPNITIRRSIYGDVVEILRTHFLVGIGWGSISSLLGTDERGAGLNASNVFFEVWLGSGLVGIVAFVVLWSMMLFFSLRQYRQSDNIGEKVLALFLFSAGVGITIFDLFNSGILLGFFFLFLSLGVLSIERALHTEENIS